MQELPERTLKTVVRDISVWMIIFILIMAGFAYRYELQDVASRMTAGLVPGSPISSTSAEGRSQVMLIKSSNGHFDAQMQIEGVPITFLVDTGATSIVLSYEDAIKIGINPNELAFTIEVNTANGFAKAARTRLNNVLIGEISRSRVTALVAQKGRLTGSLLGMNFLQTLWSFEFRGDRLILTD